MKTRPRKNGQPPVFVGFDGLLSGDVLVATKDGNASVHIHRSIRFDRTEGDWLAIVERPEVDCEIWDQSHPGMGGIVVTDPGANEFLDCLAELLASTEAFGNHDHYVGPKPGDEVPNPSDFSKAA